MATKAKAKDGAKPETMEGEPGKPKRLHRATWARDKREGGYIVRVQGPTSNRFAGRVVPVTRRDGSESEETLVDLLWTGKDQETGEPVSLYSFEPKPIERDKFSDVAF